MSKSSLQLIAYFVRVYPWHSASMVVLLVLAGLSEGFGVVALLPLLQLTLDSGVQEASGIGRLIVESLKLVGLTPNLPTLLAVIVGGIGLKGVFTFVAMRQVGFTISFVATELRLRLLRALLGANWSYFVRVPSGYFTNAISTEVLRASGAYRRAVLLFAALVQTAVYTTIALLISWQVTVLAFLGGSLILLVLSRLVDISRRSGQRETELMKRLVNRLNDTLQGIKAIKAMAQEKQVLPLLEADARELNEVHRRDIVATHTVSSFHEPLVVTLLAAGLFVALTWGGQPFSELMVMAFVFYRLLGYLNQTQMLYQQMSNFESAFHSLLDTITQAEQAAEDRGGGQSAPQLEHGIRFDDVTFAYERHPVLDHVTLEIPAGGFVTFVGPSGAGKTTLIDLLLGLQQPSSGTIFIDGIPLQQLDLRSWRDTIGYVPQEMLLFHDDVRRNITLGDPSIDDARVLAALEAAEAADFVAALPNGLDTPIGERGLRLSGGQRQRIAIARALVRRPQLLILDEITASLDPATEHEISETLARLKGKVTIVCVSHQQALMRVADTVFELRDGVVAPRGGKRQERHATGQPS